MSDLHQTVFTVEASIYEHVLRKYPDEVKHDSFGILQVRVDDEQLGELFIPPPDPFSEENNAITFRRREQGSYVLSLFQREPEDGSPELTYTEWAAGTPWTYAKDQQGNTLTLGDAEAARFERLHTHLGIMMFRSRHTIGRLETVRNRRQILIEKINDPSRVGFKKKFEEELKKTFMK